MRSLGGGLIFRILTSVAILSLGGNRLHAAAPTSQTQDHEPAEQAGSAERGWKVLTETPFFTPDLDWGIFDQLWTVWEEPLRSQAEKASAGERRKMAFSRYGLVEVPGRENGLPLQYVDDGKGGWVVNCFSCHGGKVAGKMIPGVPNTHIALQTLSDEVEEVQRRMGKSSEYMDVGLGDIPLGGSNGTSNAVIYGIVLAARRDLSLNLLTKPRPMPRLLHHDHDAPPWWNVKRKKRLYADDFAPKTHRALMPFLMVPENGAEKFAEWEDEFKDILAWIESLEAPKYPYAVDTVLAEKGRVVFNDACAKCHGTYGEDSEYPELVVDIKDVGTDPVRWKALTRLSRFGHQVSWFGFHGDSKTIVDPKGYLAPPLDGIWASAPYLHNGSIPTLKHLLNSETRPVVWKRTENGYDEQRVGLEVEELVEVPESATAGPVKRTYFDTRIEGKSREGHYYPDELSSDEKDAVLEYLKTL